MKNKPVINLLCISLSILFLGACGAGIKPVSINESGVPLYAANINISVASKFSLDVSAAKRKVEDQFSVEDVRVSETINSRLRYQDEIIEGPALVKSSAEIQEYGLYLKYKINEHSPVKFSVLGGLNYLAGDYTFSSPDKSIHFQNDFLNVGLGAEMEYRFHQYLGLHVAAKHLLPIGLIDGSELAVYLSVHMNKHAALELGYQYNLLYLSQYEDLALQREIYDDCVDVSPCGDYRYQEGKSDFDIESNGPRAALTILL